MSYPEPPNEGRLICFSHVGLGKIRCFGSVPSAYGWWTNRLDIGQADNGQAYGKPRHRRTRALSRPDRALDQRGHFRRQPCIQCSLARIQIPSLTQQSLEPHPARFVRQNLVRRETSLNGPAMRIVLHLFPDRHDPRECCLQRIQQEPDRRGQGVDRHPKVLFVVHPRVEDEAHGDVPVGVDGVELLVDVLPPFLGVLREEERCRSREPCAVGSHWMRAGWRDDGWVTVAASEVMADQGPDFRLAFGPAVRMFQGFRDVAEHLHHVRFVGRLQLLQTAPRPPFRKMWDFRREFHAESVRDDPV